MTDALTAARATLAALTANPLATSPAQQFRFCVKDFGEILNTLEAALKGQHQHGNCPDCGTPLTCCEKEKSNDD